MTRLAYRNPQNTQEGRALFRSLLISDYRGSTWVAEAVRFSKSLILPLTDLLSDPDPTVRREAGWAIRYAIGWAPPSFKSSAWPSQVIESLGKSLGDHDPNVSFAAASALGSYIHALKFDSVNAQVIREVLLPAMPYIRKYGYDKPKDLIC